MVQSLETPELLSPAFLSQRSKLPVSCMLESNVFMLHCASYWKIS